MAKAAAFVRAIMILITIYVMFNWIMLLGDRITEMK